MSAVGDRLVEFARTLGYDKASFERECGLANGFIDKTSDRIRRASLTQISQRFPQLNAEWVLNGTGDMLNDTGQGPSMLPPGVTPSITDFFNTINMLIKQGENYSEANKLNAEANMLNAEANNRNSKNIERLLNILESNGIIIDKQ